MPPSLSLLLTNDDGVQAAGLEALRQAAAAIGTPLIVASDECHSGGGHRVTTHGPLRLARRDESCYITDGTPADCVRLALARISPATDWVLAGINHGGNLGADVYMSGTVAAVREGVLHGRPGIAVSHYHRKGIDPLDWPRATRWLTPLLRALVGRPWEPGTFWNINLPHLAGGASEPEVVFCPVDPSPLPVSFEERDELLYYNGNYHQRPRTPGSDVDHCFQGRITVSLVRLS
ncbi:MAG: 5'/3'-nucleotidase SurE [Planctomycetales bacterium]